MKNSPHLSFQKGDLLAIAFVAILAMATAGVFAGITDTRDAAVVQVFQDGVLFKELSLQTDQTLTVEGEYTNQIAVRDGKVAITDSDCPGNDCMHTGWISGSGRSIVCLPNRVEIRIVGVDSDVDFTVG